MPSFRRNLRYVVSRIVAGVVVRVLFRLRVEGRDRLPHGPHLICFSHESWIDPIIVMAALPWRPRLSFFGPKEADMRVGGRNRLMAWTGMAVPYRPDKGDLLGASRRVRDVFAAGGVLAIAGEGRIHAGEAELLPLDEGGAYFALLGGVPIVPLAMNGTSWLAFGRRIRIRVGEPIPVSGRPTRQAIAALTTATWSALHELCQGYPDPTPPRPGSPWYRLTEVFNEWPEGSRPTAGQSVTGPQAVAPQPAETTGDPQPAETTGGPRRRRRERKPRASEPPPS